MEEEDYEDEEIGESIRLEEFQILSATARPCIYYALAHEVHML